jgi:hypothetical protein
LGARQEADAEISPVAIDSLTVDVFSDNVSDTYATKPAFAESELASVMLAVATEISGETLLAPCRHGPTHMASA